MPKQPPKNQDKLEPKDIGMEFGETGTQIFSGYISEDYNEKWRNLPDRLQLIDEMRNSDGAIEGGLKAIKNPILAAKYFIEPYSEDPRDLEVAEFVHEALFVRINFQHFWEEALNHVDDGASLFEKVFCIEDGRVWWERFAPRELKSLERWGIVGEPWIKGHPAGITQRLNSTDETTENTGGERTQTNQPTIPWKKLIRFTNAQKGNNFEGRSVLRAAYIHYYMKNLLYKISGIAADRFGVGIPTAKIKNGISAKDKKKLEKALQNLRANEQSYLLVNEYVLELSILAQKETSGAHRLFEYLINHHDKKIYDSLLLGFLNLTSGDGGSNALSEDQSSFFLLCEQNLDNYMRGVMDCHIKELVDYNFTGLEGYPTLKSTNLGSTSLDEQVSSIATAKREGMLTWSNTDEDKLREELKLPERDEEATQEREAKADALLPKKDKEEDLEEDEDDAVIAKKKEADEPKKKELAEILRVPERERTFVKSISDYENYLESEWHNVLSLFVAAENKYRDFQKKQYENADTERKDGVLVLAKTAKNTEIKRKMIRELRDMTAKLKSRVIDSPLMNRIFNNSEAMARKTYLATDAKFADIVIDRGRFNSFVNGYISNVKGVLYNDPRRAEESIDLQFGSQTAIELIQNALEQDLFNKNILKLSVVTHPRGAFNAILYDNSVRDGYTFYKVVIPKSKVKDLAPSGMTANVLYKVYTAIALNQLINKETAGNNTSAINGMNLHHNAFAYFLPVPSQDLPYYETLGEQQRREFEAMIAESSEE